MAEEVINSCLNLMRRMPPADVEKNLAGLVDLQPDYTDEILQRVDQPLQEQTDPDNGKQYILCDYNREADSFRCARGPAAARPGTAAGREIAVACQAAGPAFPLPSHAPPPPRSPWSNKFVPPLDAADADEVPVPEGTLRELEVEANELFDVYRELCADRGARACCTSACPPRSRAWASLGPWVRPPPGTLRAASPPSTAGTSTAAPSPPAG